MARLLILDVDCETETILCYSRETLRSGCVKVEFLDGEPAIGKFLSYEGRSHELDVDQVLHLEKGIVEEPTLEDFTTTDKRNGDLMFSAWIGFSDQKDHLTYGRKKAFADWYGLLDSSAFLMKFKDKENHFFRSCVKIKPSLFAQKHLWGQPFKLAIVYFAITDVKHQEELERFRGRMNDFEEKLKEENAGRSNVVTAKKIRNPSFPKEDRSSLLEMIRNFYGWTTSNIRVSSTLSEASNHQEDSSSQDSKYQASGEQRPSHCRLLILDSDAETDQILCYSREKVESFLVEVLVLNGVPVIGKFLCYEESEDGIVSEDNVLLLKRATVEEPTEEDYSKYEKNEHVFRTWVGYSKEKGDLTESKNIGFSARFGLLDSSSFIHILENRVEQVFMAHIVIKKNLFHKRELWKEPFSVKRIKCSCRYRVPPVEVARFLSRLSDFEEKMRIYQIVDSMVEWLAENDREPSAVQIGVEHRDLDGSSDEGVQDPPSTLIIEQSSPPAPVQPDEPRRVEIPRSPPRKQDDHQIGGHLEPLPMQHQSPTQFQPIPTLAAPGASRSPPRNSEDRHVNGHGAPPPMHHQSPPHFQPIPEPEAPPCQLFRANDCLALMEDEFLIVVYLMDVKCSAAIWRDNPEFAKIRVGCTFQCNYKSIQETGAVVFEVMDVLDVYHDNQKRVKHISNFCATVRICVDLYRESTKFEDWYCRNGEPIMKTQQGDYVLMGRMVKVPGGKTLGPWAAADHYRGCDAFQWFYCLCELALRLVPRKMVEKTEDRTSIVWRYVWVISEIEGDEELIRRQEQREENMWRRNHQTQLPEMHEWSRQY